MNQSEKGNFVIFFSESNIRASYLIQTMRRNQLLWESPLEMIMDVVGTQIMLFPNLQGFKPFPQISFITAQNLTQDIFDDEVV